MIVGMLKQGRNNAVMGGEALPNLAGGSPLEALKGGMALEKLRRRLDFGTRGEGRSPLGLSPDAKNGGDCPNNFFCFEMP